MCLCPWWAVRSPVFLLLFLLMDLAPRSTIMWGGWKTCPDVSSLFSFSSPKLIQVCRWRPPACLSPGRLSSCRYVIFYISASAVKFTVIRQVLLLLSERKSHKWPQKAAGCCLGSFRSGWNVGFDSLKTSLKCVCDVLDPVRKSGQVWFTPPTTAVQSGLTLDPPGALGQPNKTDLFDLRWKSPKIWDPHWWEVACPDGLQEPGPPLWHSAWGGPFFYLHTSHHLLTVGCGGKNSPCQEWLKENR